MSENDYDTICIDFPHWASNCPPAMKSFFSEHTFSWKNVYLFTTYVASAGETRLRNVVKMLPGSILKKQ